MNTVDNYSILYNYQSEREKLAISAGILNFIWNQWNNFWREFWIAHVSGGFDFNENKITPFYNNYDDKQACHFLLYACGMRKNHHLGDRISGRYQEVTWGDPKTIENIAQTFFTINIYPAYMTYVLGLLNHYKTEINQLKDIRNSFIHLNNENVNKLNLIASHYIFEPNQKLINILESKSIVNNTRCYDELLNNLNGMIENL